MKTGITQLIGLFSIFTLAWSCSSEKVADDNSPIVFDYNKNYPEKELKLSDVADVRYIRLKGVDEGYIVREEDGSGGIIFIDESAGRLYLRYRLEGICIFDMDGNPVRKLNRQGRGPQEYLNLLKFWVEPENNSIYCFDFNRSLLSYDTLLNFKRKIPLDVSQLKNISRIKGDTVLIYNHIDAPNIYTDSSKYFFTISSKTGEVVNHIPIYFERDILSIVESPAYLSYPSVIEGKNGVFMNNTYCDTVFWMDKRTMEITPRFVDVTDYGTPECLALPTFETDDYLFFSIQFSASLSPDIRKKFFVYDKREKAIFRLKTDVDEKTRNVWGVITDQCTFVAANSTNDSRYGAIAVSPTYLLDNADRLPADKRHIIDGVDENDNPILILIKFK